MRPKQVTIVISLCLLAILGVMSVGAQADTVRVYTSWPLQGAMQPEGQSMLRAAQLALNHYTADNAGGPAGLRVELVPLDDASPATGSWDATIEAENALRCVQDPLCGVYFATYNSGAAQASMPITNEAGVAQISPSNTYPGLTRACESCEPSEPEIYRPSGQINYFRTVPTDDLGGPSAASWAQCLGAERVYVISDNQVYGQTVADAFAEHAETIGLNVVGRTVVDVNTTDFRQVVAEIREADVDMVYGGFVIDSGVVEVVQSMFELALFEEGVRFMGSDGVINPEFVDLVGGGEVANGNVLLTFPGLLAGLLETEQGQRFYNDYLVLYGEEPSPFATYAYQSMQVILDAIDRAGSADRDAILRAMRTTTDFPGIVTPITFDENGDSVGVGFYGYEIESGAFANPTPISPTMHEDCN